MTYQFARIDLACTDYQESVEWGYIKNFHKDMIARLDHIYREYCRHKKFSSVMPMFHSRYTDPGTDVIGYFNRDEMVAFSLIKHYDQHNAECAQFAWTYHDPKLRFGIETLKTECAIYKRRGLKYLYLEQAHPYKKEISGFEILGPLE